MLTTLNERARFARERAGFSTPQAAADAIGCSRPTVIRWEDDPGAVSIGGKYLLAAAKAYKVRPEWLQLVTNDDGYPWAPPEQERRSQPVGLDVGKLADLIESVDLAAARSGKRISARKKAQSVVAVYMDEQAWAAGKEALTALFAAAFATMEEP